MHYFPGFHIATFIAGMTAGLIFMKNYRFLKAEQIKFKVITYSLALIFLISSVYSHIFQKYYYNGLLVPTYFCLIVLFSIKSGWSRFLSNKIFVYLGDISYSLYITSSGMAFFQIFNERTANR